MASLEPNMDPRSVEAVEWALWATLMCCCNRCGGEFELPHWNDPPWNEDVSAWAKEWAPRIQANGWSMADDCFNLLCPSCGPTDSAQSSIT